LTVVFVVVTVADEPPPIVNDCVYRELPLQVPLSYRVRVKEPLSALPPAEVIVAESFGSQFCAVVTPVVSVTTTVSVPEVSGHAVGPVPFVFGESPLYDATKVYVPTAVGVNAPEPYAPSPLTVTVLVPATVVQLFGPKTVNVIVPPQLRPVSSG